VLVDEGVDLLLLDGLVHLYKVENNLVPHRQYFLCLFAHLLPFSLGLR
jgi:hypothetical protein